MRQYIPGVFPDKNGKIYVGGKDYKYFANVLRIKIDSLLEVRFPDGSIGTMAVSKIEGKKLELVLVDDKSINGQNSSKNYGKKMETGVVASDIDLQLKNNGPEIWLFQFLPKPQTMDLVIRHGVECGVHRIVPVEGKFSKNVGSGASRMERWQRIVKEARQQCGSPVDTVVEEPMSVSAALDKWITSSVDKKSLGYVLHEMMQKEGAGVFDVKEKPEILALVVGAEGGIAPDEVESFLQKNFKILHFNTNVMRVDTASLYGLAVLQHAFTEFDSWQVQE